jgi:lipoprotein NlpD
MFSLSARPFLLASVLAVAVLLVGCGSTSLHRAPVEDRGTLAKKPQAAPLDVTLQAAKQLVGFENAGKPGYYTVKPGDRLIRIGLDHGQAYKDIARWSNIDNPDRIEVGQVLRVVPPAGDGVVAKPVVMASVTPVAMAPLPPASASKPATPPVAVVPTPAQAPVSATPAAADEDPGFIWPNNGPVLASFDEVKNKGVDISGAAGDPVLAAADGRVVYAGSSLRGYGSLVILKHNNTYLTAYAHNQKLLIKEDQTVKKGQKIAEMGSSDADRVKLHFEVRRQGKPVDPSKYLPAR